MNLRYGFPVGALLFCALLGTFSSPAFATTDTSAATNDDTEARFLIVQGDTLWLAEPLDVVGSRVPVAMPELLRHVDLLSGAELEDSPVRSTAEQLQQLPAVIVSQRQTFGVQSDITVRGSTFEQVQVLLDGLDLSDPQTGHHLLDLPLAQQDVQRLEVLPGHGSSLYGSGAFGGTVNVVPWRPGERTDGHDGARLELGGGGDGTWSVDASLDLADTTAAGRATGARLSLTRFRTDGYDVTQADGSQAWGGNDADRWTATGAVSHETDWGRTDIFAGYAERSFGALDFYTPYPSWERTRTLVVAGGLTHEVSDRLTLRPRLYLRRHLDRFVLLRDAPDVYTNNHVTNKVGGELRGLVDLDERHILATSVEAAYEDIDSRGLRSGTFTAALGRHLRRRLSAAVEVDRVRGPVLWQLGLRLDRRTGHKTRLTASAATSLTVSDGLKIRASAGNVFRVPTFTDLYYEDPSNRGDPTLTPETGWAWDAGLEYGFGSWNERVTYFERREHNLIEWARPVGAAIWQVMNIAEGTVRGVEYQTTWHHSRGHSVSVAYAWLEKTTTLPAGFVGKYALLAPRHRLSARAIVQLPWRLTATISGRYLEHTGGPDDFRHLFVLDGRLGWTGPDGWFAALIGTNLLDRRYEEVPGIQMPGALITASLGREF